MSSMKSINSIILKHCIYLLVILFSCNSKNNQSKISYTNKTPIDSLILIIDKENNGFEITAQKIHDMLFLSNDSIGANKIIDYIHNRSTKENKKSAFAVIELIKGYKSLWAQNYDNVTLHGNNAQKLITEQDTIIQFNIYNLIGSAYYYLNNIEAAKTYYLNGYNLAIEANNSVQIKVFANNLGSLFNNQGQLVLSEYYFSKALNTNISTNQIIDTVLVSNIYGIMINEKRFDDAKKFIANYHLLDYKKNRIGFKTSILLNTIYMEQSLQNWDLSRTLLSLSNLENIPIYQKTDYLASYATQLLNDNPSLVFPYLKHHIDLIKEDFPYSITQLKDVLSYCISKKDIIINLEEINELEKAYNFDGTNLRDESSVKYIKSLLYSQKNDFKNAHIESIHSIELTSKYNDIRDSMNTSGITSKLKLEELSSSIAMANIKIKEKEKEKKILLIIMVMGALVFTFGILLIYSFYKSKSAKLTMAQIENDKIIQEKDFEIKEATLNKRIVGLSKIIISKSSEISSKIKKLNEEIKSDELHKTIKEIDSLKRINIDSKESNNKLIPEDYQNLNAILISPKTLTLTEKRILQLSINGVKTKEIANILGISNQYILNARSKIKKNLTNQDFENWEDLKSQIDKNES
jgi:DNA-binding CsgD family transcriptional regulator